MRHCGRVAEVGTRRRQVGPEPALVGLGFNSIHAKKQPNLKGLQIHLGKFE